MAKKAREKPKVTTVDALLNIIVKKYSNAQVIRLGDAYDHPIKTLSTSSLEWDWMLTAGGLPFGFCSELLGREGIGKTTIATGIAVEASKLGLFTMYMEPEHKLTPTYFLECTAASGGDWTKIVHIKPTTGEMALDSILAALDSKLFSLIVIDSMPALVTSQEIDGATGDVFWAANAKMISQFVKQATAMLGTSDCVLLGLNQMRANMDAGLFGPKTKGAGGHAWRHAQGIKISLSGGQIEADPNGVNIGIGIDAGVGKSVVGKPRESTSSLLRFGVGLCQSRDTLTMGIKMGLIELKGAYYYLAGNDVNFAQGESRATMYLDERPQLRAELRSIMRERVVERAKSAAPLRSLSRTLPILARCGRLEVLFKFVRWAALRGATKGAIGG